MKYWEAEYLPVEHLSVWIPMTDEMLIDSGNATPDIIERYERRMAAEHAAWMARPWWVRARITLLVRWRYNEPRRRIANAIEALRGVEHECDD